MIHDSPKSPSGGSKNPRESLKRVIELLRKAIELDASLGMPHRLRAYIHKGKGQWDKGLAEAERALSLDPVPMNMYC